MKPSWDDAPEWAQWLAMDGDGLWYWFEDRPYFDGGAVGEWMLGWPSKYERCSDSPDESGIDWDHAFDTLERRP